MVQNRQEAEDIVQGLFVELLDGDWGRIDLPYLYRAVTNRCLNQLRYGENRRRILQNLSAELRGPVRTLCDERVITADLLARLSERLDGKCAEVLVYRFFDDMDVEEIARLTGTSRRTVSKRLGKIRDEVQRMVGGAAGGAA